MATGSVSALDQDTWQLIQTNTTTSGSTSTFSGLSGYKKYMVAFENISKPAVNIVLTFNGNTSNYFGGTSLKFAAEYQTTISGIKVAWSGINSTLHGLYLIENVNNGAPKTVKGELTDGGDNWIQEIRGGWLTTDPITSMTFTLPSGSFSAGAMKLYGIAG